MKRQDYETCTMIAQPTAYRWQNDRDGLQQDDAVAALRASQGASGFHEMNHPVIAQPVPFRDVSPTLTSRMQGSSGWAPVNEDAHLVGQPVPYDLFQITAPVNRQNRAPGDPCHTLAKDNAAHAAVAHAFYSTGGTHGVNQHSEVSPAVKIGSGLGIPSPPAVAQSMTVRRLTPRECERLQGFPDDWTMIPYRGKPPEECPDGPRYKALGNSMACNCMSWIGERIAAYEAQNGST
jgi:DNA (cytosine-5)-methyltransferase 1